MFGSPISFSLFLSFSLFFVNFYIFVFLIFFLYRLLTCNYYCQVIRLDNSIIQFAFLLILFFSFMFCFILLSFSFFFRPICKMDRLHFLDWVAIVFERRRKYQHWHHSVEGSIDGKVNMTCSIPTANQPAHL